MINHRTFPRAEINANAKFEFVNWNEKDLDCSDNAIESSIIDISVEGFGLSVLPEVINNKYLLNQLFDKKQKIRINFTFPSNNKQIKTFGFLVRRIEEKKNLGFEFIDITVNAFVTIRDTVDQIVGK